MPYRYAKWPVFQTVCVGCSSAVEVIGPKKVLSPYFSSMQEKTKKDKRNIHVYLFCIIFNTDEPYVYIFNLSVISLRGHLC